MDDKTELQNNNDDTSDQEEDALDREVEVDGQDIFEQRFHELMDVFGEQCEKHGIQVAMAIAIYPTPNGLDQEEAARFEQPMVFFRGEILESMSLTAEVLRNFKTQLSESLDTNPR